MEEIKGELKENLSEKDIEKRKSKLYKFFFGWLRIIMIGPFFYSWLWHL